MPTKLFNGIVSQTISNRHAFNNEKTYGRAKKRHRLILKLSFDQYFNRKTMLRRDAAASKEGAKNGPCIRAGDMEQTRGQCRGMLQRMLRENGMNEQRIHGARVSVALSRRLAAATMHIWLHDDIAGGGDLTGAGCGR